MKGPPPKPLLVFVDIECYQYEDRVFHPHLICWSNAEEEEIYRAEKVEDYLEAFEELMVVEDDERERKVVSFFYNLRGFDGNFILQELYNQGKVVEKPLTQGAKMLYFESGKLLFKDSMNFVNMGLDKFPATFHLCEMHKGFFPHKFNTPENFQCWGAYLPVDIYCPDDMPKKKREKFLAWHAEKVRENAIFVFQEELLNYCKSDVQFLKEGCLKFIKEFEEIAEFKPLEESVTIARACNLYWRRENLEEELIVLEPQNGWRGNQVNQSKVALEWLYFENWKLRGVGCVRHGRNGGEQKVLMTAAVYFVDGYDSETTTVFEFQGCYYHGCPTCYKKRDLRRNCHLDRTVQGSV